MDNVFYNDFDTALALRLPSMVPSSNVSLVAFTPRTITTKRCLNTRDTLRHTIVLDKKPDSLMVERRPGS